ncbi:hypothetical protein QYE76_018176 [Lolium multiflorum]|uniref:CCHC-type domain-containing protein n=1 Tax=Lolium multiflorum TaxID=4521 RepID=A0AAD8VC52_LOLMU|nr:hypothetical protein QYE76_018176 [Lolium multiflorum]
MDYFEEDTSASTADVEEHVELDTNYGSASIANMDDIDELYIDTCSTSMDDMVEHHLEDDIDELYIDNGSSSMDVMVEHRHDYDIDTMAEPHLDSTLNNAEAPTYPYLANGATYEDRGPPRWHHHMDHQERPQHDRLRHTSPSSTRRHHESAYAQDQGHHMEHQERPQHDRHRHASPSSSRRRKQHAKSHEPSSHGVGHKPPHDRHRPSSSKDLRRHPSRHGDETRRREPRHEGDKHHHRVSTTPRVERAHQEDLPHKATSTSCATTTMAPTSSYAYGLRCYKCKQQGHLPRECPNLLCEVCKTKGHMAWQCTTPSAKKLYFDELNAQVSKMPPLEDDLGGDGVEHGEHGILPSPTEAHGVEMVEHGMFPSTKEAHGDEQVEPTPTCLIDELVPIPCEHESHLAHLSESDSELSDFHPICEFECFHLEDMSDTQSETREVDDRSMEDIAFANTLTSPSFVSSYVALGSTEDEFPLMEKMYMVHEDDDISPCLLQDGRVDHMDPPTSTTPTSHESAFKGTRTTTSTATEHELTKRAIESYPNKDLTRGNHTKGYQSRQGPEGSVKEPRRERSLITHEQQEEEEDEGEGPQPPASTLRHCRLSDAGNAPAHPGTAAPTPALPPHVPMHCRPNRHCRPEHAGTAGPIEVNFISAVYLSSMARILYCNAPFTPGRIWAYNTSPLPPD